MSSTYTLYPPGSGTTLEQPRNPPTHDDTQQHTHRGYLSPFSPQLGSNSASPALNTNTPVESVSALSIHYQSSEYSEGDDPFFGVDFSSTLEHASPSFLGDGILPLDRNGTLADKPSIHAAPRKAQHVHRHLPLSPDKTPSLPGGSPNGQTGEEEATRAVFPEPTRTSVAPHELFLTQDLSPAPLSKHAGFHWTPRTSDSVESSDDGLASAGAMQSPRVTVSHWDRDDVGGSNAPNSEQSWKHGGQSFSAARDDSGRWVPDQVTGHSGLEPLVRSAAQVDSINDLAAQRKLSERNREVDDWLERSAPPSPTNLRADEQPADPPNDGDDNIPRREISMGDKTENKPIPGQTYYVETGGELTSEDLELMRRGRNWDDAPITLSISQPNTIACQPESSQAAIEKWNQMCRDTDSVVSRAATWGTRRLSLPSILDAEVQVAGNLLKKLSLGRRDTRRPSILEGLRGLVRKPSVNSSKRTRAEADDANSLHTEPSVERKETQAKLAPPSPKPVWPRKQSVPSINTAFVDVGSKVASIGAAHARTGSISATPITSPRSPIGRSLSVKKPLNRLRSKSETSSIVDLWKKSGGPPVSNLGNTNVNVPEADDEEEDEDDLDEDGDLKDETNKVIDDITPNFAGFQQHVLKLNPHLATANNYLVDRIAHQQCVRYKNLLNLRVKHLQSIAAKNCSSGSMCIALGGSAIPGSKSDARGLDPLSAAYEGSDGDVTPLEGAVNQDSFPPDIPMPPTASLPAEFECQLCFTAKKFQKPSDWTKHVHEDIQPFTCTWERCKEHKMFKRKADWVRHENEGHRHLEWWTCDVDDCRHKCYRRDNFLQHLVREHKFAEPKVKTKAAIKRAGNVDPTWAKVEACHQETMELPQNEACRFCGKTFPSWKKLTVHLAKHMEHISLPVLKLVAKKELDEDTIISPVQEPPPRSFPPVFPTNVKAEQHPFGPSPTMPHGPMPRQPSPMAYPTAAHQTQPLGMYPIAPPPQGYQTNLYSPNFDDLAHGMAQAQIDMSPMTHHGFQSLNAPHSQSAAAGFPTTLPVTTSSAGAYMSAPHQTSGYMAAPSGLEPFPSLSGMDALGLGLGLQPNQAGSSTGLAAAAGQQQMAYPMGLPVVEQQHRHQQQFTPQGSVSPYGHSPNMPQAGFYQ
ncbi:hypothetical protein C8A03DRAFT_34926 [Achaetomium macrosporum]|uniref:C2H2-type domain-containing protein n=1 Tax=Achaetomium macrosporum TaxID=79813 RepID=A0AAN7C8D3_9PEZI|nr:hypothetical protein C8A03DRAFT_34926 [Achaetomium macrosporum]